MYCRSCFATACIFALQKFVLRSVFLLYLLHIFRKGMFAKLCLYTHGSKLVKAECGGAHAWHTNHFWPVINVILVTDIFSLFSTSLNCISRSSYEVTCFDSLSVLSFPVLCACTLLYCPFQYFKVLSFPVLYCNVSVAVLYCTALYCILRHLTELSFAVLSFGVLYVTVLCCTTLHCTALSLNCEKWIQLLWAILYSCAFSLQVVPPDDSASERALSDGHSVKSGGKESGNMSGSDKASSSK